jgi:hypothetical protein
MFGEEIAFRHSREIILVKKLASITLLTETTQPMLANDHALMRSSMPVRQNISNTHVNEYPRIHTGLDS